jgi:hypothetical protein
MSKLYIYIYIYIYIWAEGRGEWVGICPHQLLKISSTFKKKKIKKYSLSATNDTLISPQEVKLELFFLKKF